MLRKLPALLFVLVFLAFTLFPASEYTIQDVLTPPAGPGNAASQPDDFEDAFAQGDQGGQNQQGQQQAPAYTPAPTPIPTPSPTPQPTPIPTPSPTPMGRGMSGTDVTLLQSKLILWGFLEDEPDGVYGADTEKAVKELQTYLSEIDRENGSAVAYFAEDGQSVFGDNGISSLGFSLGGSASAESTPTPSPTPTPKATAAYPANGMVDGKLMQAIEEGIPVYRQTLSNGSSGTDVFRIQRRLHYLGFSYKGIDGAFGNNTTEALTNFQKENGIAQTGIADQITSELLFSDQAKKSTTPYHPYAIKVDVSEQRVYVYAWNDGKYNKLVKKMKCSTGLPATPTPLGTYQESTGPQDRWHYFKEFNCWAQYSYSIEGNILFHSVLYNQKGGKPTSGSVRNLGRRASHGCVRLAVKDVQWIFENCPAGTTVVVQK